MRYLSRVFLVWFFIITGFFVIADAAPKDIIKKHNEMLYTVVRVEANQGSGSGVVISSKKTKEGWASYILTNHHVVSYNISIKEKYDFKKDKNKKEETKTPVRVSWFNYNDVSRHVGTSGRIADIVAYSSSHDLAILKVRDKENKVEFVADVSSPCQGLSLFETTYAVGAGLGRPPFATSGILGYLDMESQGTRYLMATSPIIFGNSGGALFHYDSEADKYELIGIPAAVSVIGGFFTQTPITHMGWAISIESVKDFLKKNKLDKLLPTCEKIDED